MGWAGVSWRTGFLARNGKRYQRTSLRFDFDFDFDEDCYTDLW